MNHQPVALDCCCGKRGWGKGLVAAGWKVVSIDIENWGDCPGDFIQEDIRKIKGKELIKKYGRISLVVASPPCQEFSYRSFPFKRCRELAANVPPDKSIWEACERIAKECDAPLVLENVRGAQKYMGKAVAHYGSFYLWGDVPALLPIGKPIKGFVNGSSATFANRRNKFSGETKRRGWSEMQMSQYSSHSAKRKEFSANAAIIPFELAYWIGVCFKS